MKLKCAITIYLGLACVALAVPRASSPSKYEFLKKNSPFTEKPIVVRNQKMPEPGMEKEWFIASVVKTTHGDEVIIANKAERSSRMRFGGTHGEGPSGYRIVSIKRGETYREDEVVLAHGGRTSTLTYDVSTAKAKPTPQAQKPAPQKKPANIGQKAKPPIPGVNPPNVGETKAAKKPRIRYVPPARSSAR